MLAELYLMDVQIKRFLKKQCLYLILYGFLKVLEECYPPNPSEIPISTLFCLCTCIFDGIWIIYYAKYIYTEYRKMKKSEDEALKALIRYEELQRRYRYLI